MSDIVNFIKNGVLLDLGLGSTTSDVVRTIGEPIYVMNEPQHSWIYNYENVEIIFGRQGIASIEVYFDEEPYVNITGFNDFVGTDFENFINVTSRLAVDCRDWPQQRPDGWSGAWPPPPGHRIRFSDNTFVLFFNEYGRASFGDNMLKTISVIRSKDIY